MQSISPRLTISLALVTVLSSCAGQSGSAESTVTSDRGTPVTAVATDITRPEQPPAGSIAIGAWAKREIRSVCVDATEKYTDPATSATLVPVTPGLTLDDSSILVLVAPGVTPIGDRIAAGFQEAGLVVATTGCDATIVIDIEGVVLRASYMGHSLYTGADVHGQLALSSVGEVTLTADVARRRDPPDTWVVLPGHESPRNPEDTPIFEIMEDELCAVFQEWIDGPFDFQTAFQCWRPAPDPSLGDLIQEGIDQSK